jgi:foldase protein PrsA
MHVIIQQIRFTLGHGRSRVRALPRWAILIVLVIGAAASLGLSSASSAEPEVVARVNGETVTRGELQRMLANTRTRQQLRQELGVQNPDSEASNRLALRRVILRRLILQEAGRRNLTVAEQDLDRAVADWRARFKGAKFRAWLKSRGLDEKSLRETIRVDMLLTRVRAAVVQDVRLTEEQVQEYYEARKEELRTAEEVRLRVISVHDKAVADEIVAALRRGEEFERLARERSLESRAPQGGDLGWVRPETLVPELREAGGALKAGETSELLHRGDEFLIVRLEERRPARTKSLADARPEIERRLLAVKQQEVFQTWLTEQEKTSAIEVLL